MVAKIFDLAGRRVFVAGHRGMVGSALVRRLGIVDCQVMTASRDKLDLLDGAATHHYLADAKPDVVIVAAAKVGGIHANSTYPAEFIQENLGIAINTIHGSYKAGVKKLLFLGSSCIYPKFARQPMSEDELLAGPLEPTNESYAVAKIAGIKLCQAYRRQYGADFISVMPTNLYGAGDNYHLENSHVVAALIRRFHEAKQTRAPSVTIWGTGAPRREFLFVDDLADACIFVLEHYSGETHLNVGTGEDTTIAEFARAVSDIVGYEGQLTFDTTRPDGSPQKLLDVSKLDAMGWRATTSLRTGLAAAYADFLADGGRGRHDR
ncbi:MAG: GDP-L-fucose synthase [Alphaproteobacteria bacterium]|jgi:GDP-L-fucose synthase|nr:GDP-L-fucose synthase [Alphaproteobacteria bacterium]